MQINFVNFIKYYTRIWLFLKIHYSLKMLTYSLDCFLNSESTYYIMMPSAVLLYIFTSVHIRDIAYIIILSKTIRVGMIQEDQLVSF